MLKVFVTAVATSSVIMVLLSAWKPDKLEQARNKYPKQSTNSTILGAMILGAGMAIAGACPGTVAVQIGMGVPNAIWAVFGGLIGAISFAGIYPYVENTFMFKGAPQEIRLGKIMGVSYTTAAAGLFVLTTLFVGTLEIFVPWKSQYPAKIFMHSERGLFHETVWNPELAGVIVGLLQLPAVALLGTGLGSSSSYVSAWVQAFQLSGQGCPTTVAQYCKFFQGGFSKWWQILYLSCAVIGSAIASSLSSQSEIDMIQARIGVPVPYAFAGGFLMVFGSRLASGCTSGHGLSGMPLMISNSFIAVAGMFGAGMVTARILHALGALPF